MGMTDPTPDFAGSLMIFVEGYGQADHRCWEHNEPDNYFWGDRGWAVGDNDRGRYCSRQATHKIRKYHKFDDAVRYTETRRRKRPKEQFFLVYALGNNWTRVSTMDEILALDMAAAGNAQSAAEPSEFMRKVTRLRDLGHSRVLAVKLVSYLDVLRKEGETAANAGIGLSTQRRYLKLLKEAGLMVAAHEE
jgi:hypothetical protein